MAGIAWTRRLRQAIDRIPNLDRLEVLPLLSVVLLLLHAPNVWYPLTLLCIVGLVFRRSLRSTTFWYMAAAMVGATVYLNWESADNHKYMICYWCLTLCCVFSLPAAQQRHALSLSSRWLIGLCMAWAVFWKALNPEYMDGSFFQYTLLADERFADFARSLTGLTRQTLADNRYLLELLTEGHLRGLATTSVELAENRAIGVLAQVLTWWTILIEAALAVAFLWPKGRLVAATRNLLLLLFGVTTYAVAPVVGFGWMLMLLGLAQCESRDRWLKLAYLGTFMLIFVYAAPVSKVLVMLLGRLTGACECW
jgi:hypothetical protein